MEKNTKKCFTQIRLTQRKNEQAYEESINKLFDIAGADALKKIIDESDKQFLLDQRGNFIWFLNT